GCAGSGDGKRVVANGQFIGCDRSEDQSLKSGPPAACVAVVVMAREPAPGTVKTRLRPLLSDNDIADLYEGFLRDRIDQIRSLQETVTAIAFTPPESRAFFAELAPDCLLLPQTGDGLSARLIGIVGRLLKMGHRGVIATDSDSPTLPTQRLQEAVEQLTTAAADVALGPCDDGGYYLIGMRRLYSELFDGIPWSTPQVYDETLKRAADSGLRVVSLPAWYDVDTPAEFERLGTELAALGASAPRHTRRFFAQRRLIASEPG
ncbi:MAG: TIGR04282 family arsenosugar biosynthesis glycosyltransferase, partial [Candidatus Tectomicrobia bacterium]|nr:TIGR04282 family arsenosugar biosynthesis glycosyltransferase [Candidatus Tectomicrobia bacterium]